MSQPLPPTEVPHSPIEHTIKVLQERLVYAEGETQKLTNQLIQYGFQSFSDKKTDDHSLPKDTNNSRNPKTIDRYQEIVTRLCQTESMIQSMRSGIQSIENEKTITKSQIIKEKEKIQESYSREIKKLRDDLKNCQAQLLTYNDAKASLECQIERLKNEVSKRISTQRNLTNKIREKDMELNAFQEKLSQLTKATCNQEEDERVNKDLQASMASKINELQGVVEKEKKNISKLNEKCDSLSNEALLARKEFEKEFENRVQLENLLSIQEEDSEIANKKIEELLRESSLLRKEYDSCKKKLKASEQEKEKFCAALDLASAENNKLRDSLKKVITDKNALMVREKELVTKEKSRIDAMLKQQNQMLDSTKSTYVIELDKQRQQTEMIQAKNIELTNLLHEHKVKISEYDFQMKLIEQNHNAQLQQNMSTIASEEQMKKDLLRKIEELENALNCKSQENKVMMENGEKLENKIVSVSNEFEKLSSDYLDVCEKLKWMEISKESNEQIQEKMSTMISEKNSLAYEKGALQTKVLQLEEDLKSSDFIKANYEETVLRCDTLEKKLRIMESGENKLMQEIRSSNFQIKKLNEELAKGRKCAVNNESTLKSLKEKNDDAFGEIQELKGHIQNMHRKHEEETNSLKHRLSLNCKEQKQATQQFNTLISSNDQLQQSLSHLQEQLGEKDAKYEILSRERDKDLITIQNMQSELDDLANKLDMMEQCNQEEMKFIDHKHKKFEEESRKLRQQLKDSKRNAVQIEAQLKDKEKQLMEEKNEKVELQKQFEDDLRCLKHSHEADLQKMNANLENLKNGNKEKENNYETKLRKLNTLSRQIDELNSEKQIYVEKNSKQAKLLEKFMKQVSGLQNELSKIIDEQNGTVNLLKEKDENINKERNKRREIEKKYQLLVRKQAVLEFQRSKKPLVALSSTVDNEAISFENKLIEEQLDTQESLMKYRQTLDKENKKIQKLEDHIHDRLRSHRRKDGR